jgi:hypothetical protein
MKSRWISDRAVGLQLAVDEQPRRGDQHERDDGDRRDHDGAHGALALELCLTLRAQCLALGFAALLRRLGGTGRGHGISSPRGGATLGGGSWRV